MAGVIATITMAIGAIAATGATIITGRRTAGQRGADGAASLIRPLCLAGAPSPPLHEWGRDRGPP
jgi:hypothetical protein